MKKLLLSTKHKNFDFFYGNLYKKEELDVVLKAKEKGNFECVYCSFVSKKYNKVHHIDGNYKNFNLKNLEVVCDICYACLHLDYAADQKLGIMIFFPLVTQEELNLMVKIATASYQWFNHIKELRVDISTLRNSQTVSEGGQTIISGLKQKASFAEKYYKSSDVSIFSNVISSLQDVDYKNRENLLSGLRFLYLYPDDEKTTKMFVSLFENEDFFKKNPPKNWIK